MLLFTLLSIALQDFCFVTARLGRREKFRGMLTHAFTAASWLMAADWKQPLAPSVGRWESKVRDFFLFMAKLSTMVKYRHGHSEAMVRF